MKQRPFAVLLALVLLGAWSSVRAQTSLKLAFIDTFSGSSGLVGQQMYDGFMLGVDQAGGKLGGLPTEVLKYDDQFKPDVGLKAAHEAIEREKVAFVTGFGFSNILIAAAKPILESGTFLISANAGPIDFAGAKCAPNFFNTSYVNPFKDIAIANYFNDMGYKRAFLLTSNYAGGREAMTGFKDVFKGQIVNEIYTRSDQIDYSPEISQLGAAKPDAAYVFYAGGSGVNSIKQFYQTGLRSSVPLYSKSTVDQINLPAEGEAGVGSFEPAHWNPDIDNPANKRFVTAFKSKYGYTPSGFAETSFDAAQLIDSAVRAVGGNLSDRDGLRKALEHAEIDSPRGTFIYRSNHFPVQDVYLLEAVKQQSGTIELVTRRTLQKNAADPYISRCPMK